MPRIPALAAAFTLAAAAAHAQAFISDGTATGQADSELIEFGADHSVMDMQVTYSKFEMSDPTNPMNALSGPCFGALEMRGGAVEGEGVCVFDGLEGDRVLIGWEARRMDPRGRITGYWTVNKGTGLWLEASGGGTFVSTVNPANNTATNALRGSITLR